MGGVDEARDALDPHAHGEAPADLDESEVGFRGQEPVQVDSSKYIKTGRVAVGIGKDGMPVVLGEGPPEAEPGLTDDNFICTESSDGSRLECEHLVTLVLPADGQAKGFGEMRQIRNFCRWLATGSEQWEHKGNVYACSARSPKDKRSLKVIQDFRKKQKELAEETSQKSDKIEF